MNYKFTILAATLVGLGVMFLWPEPAPLPPSAGSNVVVFGDSLAAGVGSTPGNDIASRLSDALSVEVTDLGAPGDTTADALERIDTLLSVDPRVVVILLGGNDAIKQKPVDETFYNLAKIIEKTQSVGAAVVLVGEPGGLYGNQYKKEYKRLAKEYRTYYVPNILSGLIGRSEYMSDLIHPNDVGYQEATARILPAVQEALQ